MSDARQPSYSFLPWVRRGIGTAISQPETLTDQLPGRTGISVSLGINGEANKVSVSLKLYGPGDVTGIDSRQVVRTDPPHLATDFEPNFFPLIEFADPGFPWLFTPAKAVSGKLRPWICLVVVRKQDGVMIKIDPSRPLPFLEIRAPAEARTELPELADSWAWAHGQVSWAVDPNSSDRKAQLAEVLDTAPEQCLSRLLCARRLDPATQYYACLVPTFQLGLKAGLGQPIAEADEKTLAPAWPSGNAWPSELPIYYHWEFSTGAAGDFASLARRLQHQALPTTVGVRPLDVSAAGSGLPDAGILQLEGALRVPQSALPTWPNEDARKNFQAALRALLNPPQTASEPIVGPPVYAERHAGQHTVPAENDPPHWLRELNLDPRFRAIAAFGTAVIQDQQEQLMASAWEQLGEIRRVNQALCQSQLARLVGMSIHENRLRAMPVGNLLQLTSPAHARVLIAGESKLTLQAHISTRRVPVASLSAAFRRVARPRGPLGRRVFTSGAAQLGKIAERLDSLEIVAVPARKAPHGMVPLDTVSDAVGTSANEIRYEAATQDALESTPGWVKPTLRPAPAVAAARRKTSDDYHVPDTDLPEGLDLVNTSKTAFKAMIISFRMAAKAHQAYLMKTLALPDQLPDKDALLPPSPGANQPEVQADLLAKLDPKMTLLKRVQGRIAGHDEAWQREDPLDPIRAAPEFPQAMVDPLCAFSQDLILPGLEHVPPNTVAMLEPNQRFIEAYMVGLNHEMSRELLWREFPAELRSSCFRQFWSVNGRVPPLANEQEREDAKDIRPIDSWDPTKHLGDNSTATGHVSPLVLLVRGELVRRYPGATIYATKAVWSGNSRIPSTEERYPLFRGTLEPDIVFLGFGLTVSDAVGTTSTSGDPGWFFVIQEHSAATRFGLDVAKDTSRTLDDLKRLSGWNDVSWSDLVEKPQDWEALTHVSIGGRLDGASPMTITGLTWGTNSAQMAAITLRPPARVALHASALLSSGT